MTGRIVYRREKGRGDGEMEYLCGLPVLSATLWEPPGLSPKRLARRIEKLERVFRGAEVSRVILPSGFPHAGLLKRVQPVETLTFCRAVADLLVLGLLEQREIPPRRARVALTAPRVCPELKSAAEHLCRAVREVRVDVPGGDGERFAGELQRRFGVPVVPSNTPVDVILSFGDGAGDLRLWGEQPWLAGLRLRAEEVDLPPDLEQPVLALLWEQGRLKREQLQVVNDPLNSPEALANAHES